MNPVKLGLVGLGAWPREAYFRTHVTIGHIGRKCPICKDITDRMAEKD